MSETIVYLVNFENGTYLAKKQPKYEWSFTNDPILAHPYKTIDAATKHGKWGVDLSNRVNCFINLPSMKTYVIEEWLIKTTMEKVE